LVADVSLFLDSEWDKVFTYASDSNPHDRDDTGEIVWSGEDGVERSIE
jgi:hypothetical protein